MEIGATNKFPDGRLGPDDEGELVIGVTRDEDGLIHFNFGKPVEWFALPPKEAAELAKVLLFYAALLNCRR